MRKLTFDLVCSRFDLIRISFPRNNHRIILWRDHFLSLTEHINSSIFKLDSKFFCNQSCSSYHSNISKHFLLPIPKPWSFNSKDIEHTSNFIQHKRCQSFSIYIFSNDYKIFFSCSSYRFKHSQNLFDRTNLLISNKNIWLFYYCLHSLSISYQIRTRISLIKLHSRFDLLGKPNRFSFFYSNSSILPNLFKYLRNQISNFFILCRNSSYLSDLFWAINRLCFLMNFMSKDFNCLVKPLSKRKRIHTRSYISKTLFCHSMSQYYSRCCSISSFFIGLFCGLLDHICSNILWFIFKFDLLCHSYSIISHNRSSKASFKDYISPLRSHSYFNSICHGLNPWENTFSSIIAKM